MGEPRIESGRPVLLGQPHLLLEHQPARQRQRACAEGSFLYQVFHTNPPGSVDTSLVSTDYMNNPRTMNAVYSVIPRLGLSHKTGAEQLTGGERDNMQLQDFPLTAALSQFWDPVAG